MIVMEGTDGSGKSTIIEGMKQYLEGIDIAYYHWRPNYLKSPTGGSGSSTGVCIDPHGKPPYSKLISIIKYLYFNFDFILGYLLDVKPRLKKGEVVVFDRYYYDYYMDKIRYRLQISDRLLDIGGLFIPKPDITFLLVGTPEILYKRKKEISEDEIVRQISRLVQNKSKFSNAKEIDVDENIDVVVKNVVSYIHELRPQIISEEKLGDLR